MWRPIELQPGEIVMMHPLVEQRLEKDFGREDLLPNRREVVDPDGTALGSRFPRDPVVAVGFDFQFAFAGTVALRAVGHGQLAGWQPSGLVENVEQRLAAYLATGRCCLLEDRKRVTLSAGKHPPRDSFYSLAAFVAGTWTSISF